MEILNTRASKVVKRTMNWCWIITLYLLSELWPGLLDNNRIKNLIQVDASDYIPSVSACHPPIMVRLLCMTPMHLNP